MTHHIKHPANWPQLEDLHNSLWKKFPLDRFEFIPSEGENAPVYAGTSLPVDPAFIVFRGEQPTVAFFDDISEAIEDFKNEAHEAVPAEREETSAPRKIA